MTEPTRRTRGLQRGPRSAQVVAAVRAATLAELSRVGFAGLTMDAVARAAQVNRTTLYRRWPSKTALLADVVEPLLADYDADPATGTAAGDLAALLRTVRDNTVRPEGRALTEAVMSGPDELRDLAAGLLARILAPLRRAVERAGADPGDAHAIAHLALSGIVLWEQTHDAPPSDEDCFRIVRLLLG